MTVKHRIQHQRYDILICKIVKVCTDLLTINKTERLTFKDRRFPNFLCLFFNCSDGLPWVPENSDVRFRSGFGQVFIVTSAGREAFFSLLQLNFSAGRSIPPHARKMPLVPRRWWSSFSPCGNTFLFTHANLTHCHMDS